MIDFFEKKHFHCYATANDDRLYYRDIQNLFRIKNTYAGVEKIELYIAISEVKKINWLDEIFVWAVKKLFFKHQFIELKKIFFKTNVGRDFSSYSMMKDLIITDAAPGEYVFFQNRSGYGPFRNGWLKALIMQFEKNNKTALCGSTINFRDHPNRSLRNDLPHVQTYAFLTKISFLKKLGRTFPGEDENSRLEIILRGEIGLSQFFINSGFGITCMEWPDKFITNASNPINNKDIKDSVTKAHQFYHKVYLIKDENALSQTLKSLNMFFLLLVNGFIKIK